ncbi:MAG: MFS transporter [Phycisphaerales bacterium]
MPLVLLLILLSALPDAMLAVVLRDLFVERYGVPAESAQMFLAVNLLGAGLAVPLVRWLRKSCPAWSIVVSGALADAALLGLMWLPIGFAPTLVLRVLEGVADVATFAALFQILGQVHDRPAAWRMGVGASMLVGGLGAGAAIGGAMIRLSSMGPTIAFVLGAGSCLATALGAWIGAAVLERSAPSAERPECGPPARSGSLWPVLLMAASDRATGAALTAVFAGFLARNLGYDPAQRGLLVGLPLILMAVGAAPAGWVADRLGALRVRTACAVAYALCFALVPWLGFSTVALSLVLLLLGVAAAPLLPASLSLASRAGRGTSGLAAFRAAGDGGYFLGILAVVTVGALAGGDRMGTQQALMAGFGLLHLACTAGTVMAMRRER